MEEKDAVFAAFLLRLEPDVAPARRYQHVRQKMIKFFSWRYHDDPDGLADETIARTAKNLGAGERVWSEKPYSYVYAIANNVLKEQLRDKEKRRQIEDAVAREPVAAQPEGDADARLECMRECLESLPEEKRLLIGTYYTEGRGPEAVARARRVTLNALRIQIHRLKQELRRCKRDCLENLRTR